MGTHSLRQLGDKHGWLAFVLCLGLLTSISCSSGSKEQVLGAWVNEVSYSNFRSIEFREDNTLTIQLNGQSLSGTWKVVNKYRVFVTLEAIPGKFEALKTLFALSEGKLIWSLPGNGGEQTYIRAKQGG